MLQFYTSAHCTVASPTVTCLCVGTPKEKHPFTHNYTRLCDLLSLLYKVISAKYILNLTLKGFLASLLVLFNIER